MSKPKALRFRRVEAKDPDPSWVEASKQAPKSEVQALRPPTVEVQSIDYGVQDEDERPVEVAMPGAMDWEAVVAPLFGTGRSGAGPEPGTRPRSLAPGAIEDGGREMTQPKTKAPAVSPEEGLWRQRFEEAVLDLSTARQELLAQAESQLLDLAMHIAEAIIESEVERKPELHDAFVRAALSCVEGERSVDLQLAPLAYRLLKERHGAAVFDHNGVQVTMHEKASLGGLGCVVETGNVRVDGRVHQRLLAVRRSFEELRLAGGDPES